MNRLIVDLHQEADEIVGHVEFSADHSFTVECLTELAVQFSKDSGVPLKEILQDVWRTAHG